MFALRTQAPRERRPHGPYRPTGGAFVRLGAACAVLVLLAGCGSAHRVVMPDVRGKKLDVAERDIKDAGIDAKVSVDGGGLFGVIVKSNWTVCRQSPAAGRSATGAPRLTVARSCGGSAAASPTASASASPSVIASASASASASVSVSASASASVSASPVPTQPSAPATLTAANSAEFAAVLADPTGDCDSRTKAFAEKYADKTIEFNGRVANMMLHGNDQYLWDILIASGKFGPAFKFDAVNIQPGWNGGANLPANSKPLQQGDKIHVVAKVGDFDGKACLFHLDPVSTSIR